MATIYVSPGDNVNSKINSASAGDEVILRNGVYNIRQSSKITVTRSNIKIRGEDIPNVKNTSKPISGVILDGGWNTTEKQSGAPTPNIDWYIFLISAKDVTVEGIQIRYAPSRGFGVTKDGARIRNCSTWYSYKQALMVQPSDDTIVENCRFARASQMIQHQSVSGNRWSASCVFRKGATNCIFRNNLIYQAGREGFIFGPDAEDCEAYGNHLVDINLLYGYITTSKRCKFYGNFIYQTSSYGRGAGFTIRNETQFGSYVSSQLEVHNNLFVGKGLNVTAKWTGGSTVIEHNTFYDGGTCELRKPSSGFSRQGGNVFRNNVMIDTSLSNQGGSSFTASNNGSGTLVNPSSTGSYPLDISKFHQTSGSASVNDASGSGVPRDYLGSKRVGTADRGFHEYNGTPTNPDPGDTTPTPDDPPASATVTSAFTISKTEPREGEIITVTDTSFGENGGVIDGWLLERKTVGGSWSTLSSIAGPWTIDTDGESEVEYRLRLTVSDASESISDSSVQAYTLYAAPEDPVVDQPGGGDPVVDAEFTLSNTSPAVGDTITLTDASTDTNATIDDWDWEYSEDGGLSFTTLATTQGPHNFTFTKDGEHIFYLTVQDVSEGVSSREQLSVFVTLPDVDDDTDNLISNGSFGSGTTSWSVNQGSGSASINVWDVDADGDDEMRLKVTTADAGVRLYQGSVSVTESVSYRLRFYAWARLPATMDVKLTDTSGNELGLDTTITVETEPQEFDLTFTASDTDAAAQLRFIPEQTDQVNYFFEGVRLVALSNLADPQAGFTISSSSINLGSTITVTDSSAGPVSSWIYTLNSSGGDTLSTAQNFVWTPTEPGTFEIVQTVFDAFGLDDSTSRTVYVSTASPTLEAGDNPQIVAGTANTSGASQSFTYATAYTSAPAGAIYLYSGATADDTNADDAIMGIGATDGTNEWAIGIWAEDGEDPTKTRCRGITDGVVLEMDTSGVTAEAAHSALGTSSLDITWSDFPASARKMVAIPLPYTDVKVGTFTLATDAGDTTDVSFGWDATSSAHNTLVLFAAIDGAINDSTINHSELCLGILDPSQSNYCAWSRSGSGSSAGGACFGRVSNNRVVWSGSTTDVDYTAFAALTSDGMTVTVSDGDTTGSIDVAYVAIDLGTQNASASLITSPTATGEYGYQYGFNTGLSMIFGTLLESVNSSAKADTAGVLSVGVCDNTADYSIVRMDEDKADPSNTKSRFGTNGLDVPQDDGTTGLVGAMSLADGPACINYTSVLTTPRYALLLQIEAVTVDSETSHDPIARNLAVGLARGLN